MPSHQRTPTPQGLKIGATIRAAREALEWTQADLARHTGIGPSYFSSVEAGTIKDPAAGMLYRIALALGETMESLMGVQELRRTTKANVRRRVVAEAQRRSLAEAEERYARARLAEERATAERMEAERVIAALQLPPE